MWNMTIEQKVEIINKIEDKFKNAEKLSIVFDENNPGKMKCYYSHDINGIGCAIGCLLSPERAQRLEEEFSGVVIMSLLSNPIALGIIGDDIDTDNADPIFYQDIQTMHDESATVDEFLDNLAIYKYDIQTEKYYDEEDIMGW